MQIKDFTSIVASMINHMRTTQDQVTDFNVGSVARTMVEAPAVEIEEAYLQFLQGLMDSIPLAIYTAWGFARAEAVTATGQVLVTRASSAGEWLLPAGTTFAIPETDRRYQAIDGVLFQDGVATMPVLVRAQLAGAAGNTIENTVTAIVPPINGVSVNNPDPIRTGQDQETDTEMRLRFASYVRSLARGTVDAILFIARQSARTDDTGAVVESAQLVALEEQIPGLVIVYVYNGTGGTSNELLAETLRLIDGYTTPEGVRVAGYRAGGIEVRTRAMLEVPVDVTLHLTLQSGVTLATVEDTVVTVVSGIIRDLPANQPLFLSRIVADVLAIAGINAVDIEQPAANVPVPLGQVLVPGQITVTGS